MFFYSTTQATFKIFVANKFNKKNENCNYFYSNA